MEKIDRGTRKHHSDIHEAEPDGLFRIQGSYRKGAAAVLAEAFQEDPLYIHLFPGDEQRPELLQSYFLFRIRYGVLFGEVQAVSGDLEGVAVWIRSEYAEMTMIRSVRAWGFLLFLKTGGKIMDRLNEVSDYVSLIHRKHTDFPHWHLSPMGVAPRFQGKGYGRLLLTSMLSRLDREGMPCFLETQKPGNVEFYGRYGFNVVEKGQIPGTDIDHWAMLREPGPK